jgi:tRNA threonylcarbamoyl adenosine modification protein (Sua5/YciO/YrdC/YwlC family)
VNAELESALGALARGEIIGLPTDTVYGIGADPFQQPAVQRLFEIKGRPEVKPIPILAADLEGVARIGQIDPAVAEAARRFWPGGLTIIARRAADLPDWIGDAALGTVGLRVPAHDAALAVLARSGPLAVTSANRSGDDPAVDDTGARAVFGADVAVYVSGRGAGDAPSTVVDLTRPEPRVLRRGPVDWGSPR